MQGATTAYRLHRQHIFAESGYGSVSVEADGKGFGESSHKPENLCGKPDRSVWVLHTSFVFAGYAIYMEGAGLYAPDGNADDQDRMQDKGDL